MCLFIYTLRETQHAYTCVVIKSYTKIYMSIHAYISLVLMIFCIRFIILITFKYIYLYTMDYAETLPCASRDDDDDHDDDLCYWCFDDHQYDDDVMIEMI